MLRDLRPKEAARLDHWRGNELRLIQEIHSTVKGQPTPTLPADEYQAAVRAGRIGYLLAREADAPRPEIPKSLAQRQPEIDRLAARLHAFSIPNPFTRDALTSTPPRELDRLLDRCRKEGLLENGPGWTLHGQAARQLTQEIRISLDRSREADHLLTDRLIKGMVPR